MPVSESFPVRGSMVLAGCLTAALLILVMVPDKGEVVQLITENGMGEPLETELWIVELDGELYFRGSNPDARWLTRLRSGAPASLERKGQRVEIEASFEDDPEIRARLSRAMSEKYGLADRLWGLMRSSDFVAIRIFWRRPSPGAVDSIGSVGSLGTHAGPLDPE